MYGRDVAGDRQVRAQKRTIWFLNCMLSMLYRAITLLLGAWSNWRGSQRSENVAVSRVERGSEEGGKRVVIQDDGGVARGRTFRLEVCLVEMRARELKRRSVSDERLPERL